jgi:hypothetical protein
MLLLAFFITSAPGAPVFDVRWRTLVENPWFWTTVLVSAVVGIGGAKFIERRWVVWQAEPRPARSKTPTAKQRVEVSEGVLAMASVLRAQPAGDPSEKDVAVGPVIPLTEPPRVRIVPSIEAKPRKPLSEQAQRTVEKAAEIDRLTKKREDARRAFNALSPSRPMTDLDEDEWLKLDLLFRRNNQELSLKFPPDTTNRDEDALLLLLFGYRQIYDREKVEARTLERGLYLSNCRRRLPPLTGTGAMLEMATGHTRDDRIDVDELAKSWVLEGEISEKFGLASGGFYAITDKGMTEIRKLFDDLVRRA